MEEFINPPKVECYFTDLYTVCYTLIYWKCWSSIKGRINYYIYVIMNQVMLDYEMILGGTKC